MHFGLFIYWHLFLLYAFLILLVQTSNTPKISHLMLVEIVKDITTYGQMFFSQYN